MFKEFTIIIIIITIIKYDAKILRYNNIIII